MFIAFILALIALAMGSTLVLRAKKHAELGTGGCKFLGYLIGILALIVLCFIVYVFVAHFIVQATGTSPTHMMNIRHMMKK